MKYSFIIPVYNCEKYLEACVESILSQNITDFEILLIEDGSKDSTPALCDRLAQQISQVKAFHQPNGGVSAARNRGIREASGDYLLFVDADDVLFPFSQSIWKTLESDIPDCLIFGMRFQYMEDERIVREEELFVPKSQCMDLVALGENFRELFVANCFSSSCNKFYKRCVLLDHNIGFDPRLTVYEDLAFSLRFLAVCKNIYVSSEIAYLYQIRGRIPHASNRLAKIEDVIGGTDVVADAFRSLENVIQLPNAREQIRISVFDVYMVQFWAKVQTLPFRKIGQLCESFCQNAYIQECLPFVHNSAQENNPMFQWIFKRAVLQIWIYVRYRKVRNTFVSKVKRLLNRLR